MSHRGKQKKSAASQGCSEYRGLSRRDFITRTGAGVAAGLTLPGWLPRATASGAAPQGDVFISIFLRGGFDGLSFVAPLRR